MSIIKEVSTPTWEVELKSGLVLVLFSAPWCESCKVQEAILRESLKNCDNCITVLKLNSDDNRWLSQKLGVRNIPMLIKYENGVEVKRYSNMLSKEIIEKEININK